MKIHKILFTLSLALIFAANCMAQDETKTSRPQAKKAIERAVKSTMTQMMKAFEAAKLTDEQKEKAQVVVAKLVPKIVEARDAQNNLLTEEQKAKRKAALAKAKEEGVKGKKVAASAIKAMELSDEELKKFNEANKKVTQASAKVKEAIMELLTDEQKASMPTPKTNKAGGKAGGKGKKKKDNDADNN